MDKADLSKNNIKQVMQQKIIEMSVAIYSSSCNASHKNNSGLSSLPSFEKMKKGDESLLQDHLPHLKKGDFRWACSLHFFATCLIHCNLKLLTVKLIV